MDGLDALEKMTGLDKLKLAIGLLLVLAILAGAFSAGWVVNGWRKDAGHAKNVKELTAEVTKLQGQVNDQNHATDLLNAKKSAADDRRKLAEQYSVGLVNEINKRKAVTENTTATDCDGVLKEGWENAR